MTAKSEYQHSDSLIENALNGIYQCNEDGAFLSVNAALARMLGYASSDELGSEQFQTLLASAKEADIVTHGLRSSSNLVGMEVTLKPKEGPMVQAVLNGRWVERDGTGNDPYHEGILTDISHLKRQEEELLHLATHDPLTGLHNRREFNAIFERHLSRVRRYGDAGALLWMDLDGFKQINDSLGHNAGDELLSSIAHRMKATVRDSDVVARLGGDEFAVLYPNVDEAQAKLAAGRLLDAIRKHSVVIEGQILRSTSSMGVVLFPEHGNSASELFLKADMAMYRAKASGRNRITMYSYSDEKVENPESRIDWLRVIREALENDSFVLYAQPILDLKTNRIVRYEILLRLRDQAGNLIPPGAFLDVAEQFGLSGDIDRWVLRKVMDVLGDASLGDDLSFAVNLSPRSLTDPELLAMVTGKESLTIIGPVRLVLEITESAAIYNIHVAKDFLRTLRTQGYEFALDDFGKGFSSFYQLKNLDVDYLKIDGSFVRNLSKDPVDKHLVTAMVTLAGSLGKQTIAEFVEDEETLEILRSIGVDCAQGFYIGRPSPLDGILEDLRNA
ncbi:EAL domain-containing protein [Candidatus Bipolaricaulota bacterium]|nr:EAL domain-containing protein [Candidatus Bipolaricaulota bacterium]